MPDVYGLTADGFVVKPTLVILQEMQADYRETFGDLNVDGDTPDGVTLAIVAERAGECWELGEAVYASQSRESASGRGLDNVCLLLGTFRPGASYSTVTLTLTGTPTTFVPESSRAAKESTGEEFRTQTDTTIVAVSAWLPATGYSEGQRVTNGGNVYQCRTAGTSDGSGGPTTEDEDITDNTAHWRFLGAGTGAVDVTGVAMLTGPTVASSGEITEIVTPVSGWDGVINIDAATKGQVEGSDADLRLLAEAELQQAGSSPVPAIRAAILDVDGVTNCTVFHNTTDLTDADGVPPHSVEVLVTGGEDEDIFEALFAAVSAGIGYAGSTVGTVTDDEGLDHEIKFSRPTEIPIYISIDVLKDPDEYPSDGDDQVEAAIVENEGDGSTGTDVVARRIGKWAFDITGVLDTPTVRIGTAPGPTLETTIAITKRQIATYSTSRITVNASNGTP